ncbi:MAG: TraM recognition domain-containing protein [Flavobacteriaceae bacterium]|nr:TraM recognition domain-containing protein [Flavobacteriaceae bacterium]
MLLIDETPTLYLPKFVQIPATGRSNKLAVIIGAQDISQLEDTYTKTKAEVLISNLGTQFYGRTTNQATAERVVKMFGQREDIQMLHSTSKKGFIDWTPGRSKSQSIQKRDRVKIQEMTTLEQGEFVGMIAEGTTKEFKGKIKLQESSIDLIKIPKNESYSVDEANKKFENIYKEVEEFIKEETTKEDDIAPIIL